MTKLQRRFSFATIYASLRQMIRGCSRDDEADRARRFIALVQSGAHVPRNSGPNPMTEDQARAIFHAVNRTMASTYVGTEFVEEHLSKATVH